MTSAKTYVESFPLLHSGLGICVEGVGIYDHHHMETQLIRRAEPGDAKIMSEIYNWYILHSTVTFETKAIDELEMRRRIQEKLATHDWLVAEVSGQIVGYAYYGAFRPRPAYAHTVESTIYLSEGSVGKGFGTLLYSTLIRSAVQKGFLELIGVIALPNAASVKLHAKLGFREAGRLEGIGRKFGSYIDVALWQRRTSPRARDRQVTNDLGISEHRSNFDSRPEVETASTLCP